jgi:hypothetical protein
MTVRIDRAYRSRDQKLTLVEFKLRSAVRTQLSDVVELSVQRYVMNKAGHQVRRRAYVVVLLADGRCSRALPVELEDGQEVERRAARLLALRQRRVLPAGTTHPAVCRSCGHRDVCTKGPHVDQDRGS